MAELEPLSPDWWNELKKIRKLAYHVEPLAKSLQDLLNGPPLEGLTGGRIEKAQEVLTSAKKDM